MVKIYYYLEIFCFFLLENWLSFWIVYCLCVGSGCDKNRCIFNDIDKFTINEQLQTMPIKSRWGNSRKNYSLVMICELLIGTTRCKKLVYCYVLEDTKEWLLRTKWDRMTLGLRQAWGSCNPLPASFYSNLYYTLGQNKIVFFANKLKHKITLKFCTLNLKTAFRILNSAIF